MKAICYDVENGGKQRALPRRQGLGTLLSPFTTSGRKRRFVARFGNYSKRRAYRRRFSVLSLDSTFVKPTPSVAGALKKRAVGDRTDKERKTTRDEDSYDRRRSAAARPKTLAWERRQRDRCTLTLNGLSQSRF